MIYPRLKQAFEINRIVRIVGIIVSLILVYNTILTVKKNYALQQEVDNLRHEVDILALENKQIELRIAYLKTDEFLELAAREKFNKKAPGEHVVVLPPIKSAASTNSTEIKTPDTVDPPYLKHLKAWLNLLFGWKV